MLSTPCPDGQYKKAANYLQPQYKSHSIKPGAENQAFLTQCRYCESENLEIREGKGPHAAGVWCGDCEGHQKWLNKLIAKSLGFTGGEA